jgi:hypothetical protein
MACAIVPDCGSITSRIVALEQVDATWPLAGGDLDCLQNLGQIFANQLIREPDHPIPCCSQDRLTFRIMVPLLRMNATIQLDHKATLRAAEVDNEQTDWMLPAELHPVQSPSTQFLPQEVLNRCLASAQIPRRWDVVPVIMSTRAHVMSFARQRRQSPLSCLRRAGYPLGGGLGVRANCH